MKKTILSLAALCVLATFSSGKLMSAESSVYRPFSQEQNVTAGLSPSINSGFSLFTTAPVTYRNAKPDAGYVEINDLTTGQTYSAGLPPTGTSPVSTGIILTVGDRLEVTVYSGNGNCSITCNGSTQTGVSSLSISQPFMPNPSWIIIQ